MPVPGAGVGWGCIKEKERKKGREIERRKI
jgi:hypothetical protein